MKSKTYLVAWDEVLKEYSLPIQNQLFFGEADFLVYDLCSEPIGLKNWVEAEKVRYYGHFYNALKDFASSGADIFIFNAGDALASEQGGHMEFIRRVEKYMSEDEDIWMLAPIIRGDASDGVDTLVAEPRRYWREKLALTIHVNGIYVALRKELALDILGFYEWMLSNKLMDFSVMTTGHCLDVVYAAWAIYKNKKIYRDMSFYMTTNNVTSYDTMRTDSDCFTIKELFLAYLDRTGEDSSALKAIYDAIQEKDYQRRILNGYPIKKLYVNMSFEQIQEFDY
jgi:hypothetical protein